MTLTHKLYKCQKAWTMSPRSGRKKPSQSEVDTGTRQAIGKHVFVFFLQNKFCFAFDPFFSISNSVPFSHWQMTRSLEGNGSILYSLCVMNIWRNGGRGGEVINIEFLRPNWADILNIVITKGWV